MSIEDNIQDLSNSLDHIADQINANNDFGFTTSDELHNIDYNISRVADALEGILKIMKAKMV